MHASDETEPDSALKQSLKDVDEAVDRTAARNRLIRTMISESDKSCVQYLSELQSDAEQKVVLKQRARDALDKRLQAAIALRRFDHVDADKLLLAGHDSHETAVHAVNRTLAATIRRSRAMSAMQLSKRLEADITAYSLKQALLDVSAYHDSCSADFAVIELTRTVTEARSADERSASMAALIQLRKQLISQGISTRVLQQKIDALIMDY